MQKSKRERKKFYQVDIIDTADEGLAIGRCDDGLIILVKGAVPGDKADVVALEKRKGMYITKVEDLLELSPERVTPFCSHFGTCGGCKWQHMHYEAQLKYKEKKVRDAFKRIGGLDDSLIGNIIGAPLQTYYRNKLEFTASDRRWLTDEEIRDETILERDGIGFHLVGAFDKVLDIQHCYLQPDPSNEIRHLVKRISKENNWPFFNLKTKQGFLRNIIVRNNLEGQCMVVLVVGESMKERVEIITKALHENFPQVISVYSCVNTKVNDSIHDVPVQLEWGDEYIRERLEHVVFNIGPKSFFQTNSLQAKTLYSIARQLAQLSPADNVYDLYCGVGSLGIFMADQCSRVVGIEQIPEAIMDAKENAILNRCSNVFFETGQVELLLDPAFIHQHGSPDVIITDPPRAGMHPDAVAYLASSGADRIVYVSCNPSTQARDIKLLSPAYTLISAMPVDMFPHTHHIECVALLKRS